MPSVGETYAQYQLVAEIARPEGSVTEAFRALDTNNDNIEVVLEIVRAGATSVEKARFGTRSRRLVGLNHPSLTRALEVTATHCAFEASLSGELLVEQAGVAIARARQKLSWLSQISAGLAALHKVAVVHGQLGLDQVFVMPDVTVKLAIPVGGDVSGSPLDDVRAFGAAACELVLGVDPENNDEATVKMRVHEAGVPPEAAAILARARAGAAMTSADLAEKLAPFVSYSGPSTEPLLRIVPATEPLLQVAPRNPQGSDPSD